ncbi:transcription initiation factor TFIID subunit 2 isoform X3 [Carya illinoinensis]|nr:transcription initiation factor TFIID subunit 2 isoform X3 [Carya illinoinensis]
MEFTVAQNLVAVSNGNLQYQVLSKDDPPRKTYVYSLNVPVAAQWISLAVAPFEILPDHQFNLISHICLSANMPKLRNTMEFFHSAFSCYKDYLSVDFPFESYKQVFIEPEMAVSSVSLGASMSIFSSQALFDEKVIDQTIDTRIKLAYALARQWFGVYITPEAPNDEWLLDGLAGFLTDYFIKKNLGNNEARYRRYKANCAVCKADYSGATALSLSASCKDLYGTQCIGLIGKIRSWKAVAIIQMLEKQMGPESFRNILQTIVSRAQDSTRTSRSLSTKEFRHLANKVGNLERPFLKEFFPRWVGSCGCPVLRMGFSYNKRKNMVELAVLRGCTASPDSGASVLNINADSENRESDIGWPGMMSIRIYELDGMYDHPILPMAGDIWQLLEIQCHSKLAARRFQKPKKGSKPDGSDDNGDVMPALDMRSSSESPLLWMRADPEMEYLAEIHFNQPLQMWINQLEKDKDVIAQAQAVATLEALPQLSFSVVNALNSFLTDSKAFWRLRIEAAFALANTASEETDWAGLVHLVKFYKSRRFDANIGLPKPNDFHDFPEYFVLEAIPHAVAMVRAADKKSPREAVEFILQLLKYNDNNGNTYSDVFWLAALVQSVGELEFGQQSVLFLTSLLKRIDRLLQFDRLMPSHNGILTVSCIRTLTQIALKLSEFIPLDRVIELIRPFRDFKTIWQVRIEASRALLDLEFHCKGIDAALSLFIKYLEEEPSFRGQVKLGVHAMRLCQISGGSDSNDNIKSEVLVSLLLLLDGRIGFNNVFLRHHLFCIIQILAGRSPTLCGVPRETRTLLMGDAETSIEQKNIISSLVPEMKLPDLPSDNLNHPEPPSNTLHPLETPPDIPNPSHEVLANPQASKEADTVSSGHERKMPSIKIRVKQSAATSRTEDADNQTVEKSQGRQHETDHGASSSVSVDAPQRNFAEVVSISNQNLEEVNSCHDHGSRMTASIGSAKPASDGDEIGKELQCTADSSKVSGLQSDVPLSSSFIQDNNIDADAQKFASLQTLSVGRSGLEGGSLGLTDSSLHEKEKKKKKKKGKEKKRKREDHKERRDDPEYLERKRLKKEKKQKEKEMAKLLSKETNSSSVEPTTKGEPRMKLAPAQLNPNEPSASDVVTKRVANERRGSDSLTKRVDVKPEASEGTSAAPKIRIKIKNRTLNKS